jgi:hypothetical protein
MENRGLTTQRLRFEDWSTAESGRAWSFEFGVPGQEDQNELSGLGRRFWRRPASCSGSDPSRVCWMQATAPDQGRKMMRLQSSAQ